MVQGNAAQLSEIIESLNDAVLILGWEGDIIDLNRIAHERLGYSREELLSMNITQLDPPEFPQRESERLEEIRRKGAAIFESAQLRKDGTAMPVEVNSRIIDYKGKKALFVVVRDITERKQSQKHLAESEDKYQKLFNNGIDAICIFEIETRSLIDVNNAFLKLYGYSREEALQLRVDDVSAEPEKSRAAIHSSAEGGDTLIPVRKHRKKDGTVFFVELSAGPFTWKGKRVMFSVLRDITARLGAERALQASEKKYRSFVENLHGISYRADVATWTPEFFHGRVKEITGYSEEDFIAGKSRWDQIIHPDDFDHLPGKEALASVPGYSCAREYRIVRKDGQVRWVAEHVQNTGSDANNIVTIDGIITDITDRKTTEKALRESEESFREFVLVQPDPIEVLATDGTILICNDASAATYGSSAAERIGKNALGGLPPAVVAERRALLDRVASTRQSTVIEEEVKGKVYETRITPIVNRSGEVLKIAIFPHDITWRKRAEENLRESEEYIKNILNTVDEGFIVVDRDYRILSANKAYCEQVGRSEDDAVGRHCYEISHKTNRPCYEAGEECAVRRVFETGKPHAAVHEHPGPRELVLFVETKAFPVKDRSGRVTSAIESISNITEKQLLAEERLKTQKLESIGTLAGGIAHDFNNLLQGVFGYISMARVSIDRKEESLAMIEQAEEALQRTVSLTNQLLTFAKGGKPVIRPVPILPVVESAVRFALSGSSCEYEILPQGGLWQVNGDAGQVGQVIQNIALNADQSMPLAGKIWITLRNLPADCARPAGLEAGDYVMISIRDTGSGIPEQHLERIFDPYFTTKARGSGLGLATSYSIVRNHRGSIDVESQPGEGATFTICLPAVREKLPEPEAVAAPAATRCAKVLVMDDDELVREVAGQLVRALGHQCEFAEKGETALAMFKAARDEGRPFDLVLLDLTIRGGMGGVETMRQLLFVDPDVKAIVSSGYSDDAALADYRDKGFGVFLKKPYKMEELRVAINSLLV